MEMYYLIRFKRKTGQLDTELEGLSKAMLKMWALHNTPKTMDCIIFNKETGEVVNYFTGRADFPKVEKEFSKHINDYCQGLLERLKEEC